MPSSTSSWNPALSCPRRDSIERGPRGLPPIQGRPSRSRFTHSWICTRFTSQTCLCASGPRFFTRLSRTLRVFVFPVARARRSHIVRTVIFASSGFAHVPVSAERRRSASHDLASFSLSNDLDRSLPKGHTRADDVLHLSAYLTSLNAHVIYLLYSASTIARIAISDWGLTLRPISLISSSMESDLVSGWSSSRQNAGRYPVSTRERIGLRPISDEIFRTASAGILPRENQFCTDLGERLIRSAKLLLLSWPTTFASQSICCLLSASVKSCVPMRIKIVHGYRCAHGRCDVSCACGVHRATPVGPA
jgi:hypothetical protein